MGAGCRSIGGRRVGSGDAMPKILHLLRSVPDDTVADLITAMSTKEGATVICLYPDAVADTPVDWNRLIDDIMAHETIICWW